MPKPRTSCVGLAALLALLAGCAATKKPILYPNDHLKAVGDAQAQADIADCEARAKEYASPTNVKGKEMAKEAGIGGAVGAAGGAVGGAIGGNPGEGAAVGAAAGATAGLLSSLFRGSLEPSSAYMNWVNTCLQEKGYQTVGWE